MLVQIVTENGQKKVIPLTADAGAGLPVGFIAPAYKKGNYSGWLYLDGRDTTGTSEELSTHYPILYAFLGSNKLPDYREFALVGAEENTTDVYNASTNPNGTIHDHDVYTEGQAKDDQLQDHTQRVESVDGYKYRPLELSAAGTGSYTISPTDLGTNNTVAKTITAGRHGTVTRGKRKAVYFYIKATSGLSENAQDNVINTLNEERSYSTSEVNTGKKWIDGKPIYRKVIKNLSFGGTVGSWDNTGATITNVSKLIKVDAIKSNEGPVNFMNFGMNGNNLQYVTYHNWTGTDTVIVEYTKTT